MATVEGKDVARRAAAAWLVGCSAWATKGNTQQGMTASDLIASHRHLPGARWGQVHGARRRVEVSTRDPYPNSCRGAAPLSSRLDRLFISWRHFTTRPRAVALHCFPPPGPLQGARLGCGASLARASQKVGVASPQPVQSPRRRAPKAPQSSP